jgi:hypothetical protein
MLEVRAHVTPLEPNKLDGTIWLRTTSTDIPVVELKLAGVFLPQSGEQTGK